jgi:thioredoxin reductase
MDVFIAGVVVSWMARQHATGVSPGQQAGLSLAADMMVSKVIESTALLGWTCRGFL